MMFPFLFALLSCVFNRLCLFSMMRRRCGGGGGVESTFFSSSSFFFCTMPPRTAALRKLFDFERRKRWTNSAENITRVVVAVGGGGGGGGDDVLVLLVWSDKDDARIGKACISSTFTFALASRLALSLCCWFFRCGLVFFLRLRLCFFFTRFESEEDAGWRAAVVVVGLGFFNCRFFSLFG